MDDVILILERKLQEIKDCMHLCDCLNESLDGCWNDVFEIIEELKKPIVKDGDFMCVVCHKIPVDVSAGYDTCHLCASRI